MRVTSEGGKQSRRLLSVFLCLLKKAGRTISVSVIFRRQGLPDIGLSVHGRGCGALRKVRRTLAGIPLFGDVWSLSHFVADPGRSFRAGRFGDWGLGRFAFPSSFLLTVGGLPPGCPGCRGRSDVGVIFACRRCPGRCSGCFGNRS